ncbi:hypothetical protein PZH32_06800 [Adlercreutzia equolifaciens]|uniref:hypothetical protein n=1 Tax=Adlercreutzia equolifaciens TaxID=446660 RepID=UPI0023AF6D86|nr:hypothetical protein [Adlercreutzia equolifaciens]MDE8702670.1 hypothetical protein [Adlercreutzia equolifaciens]
MSGPKTSQLEIERRIQAQLAALRSDVNNARSKARARILARRDALLAAFGNDPSLEDAAESVRALAAAALARLDAECAFEPCAAMEDSVASAAQCGRSAASIADAFENDTAPFAARAERARNRAAARQDQAHFLALLAEAAEREEAIAEGEAAIAQETASASGNGVTAQSSPSAASRGDQADNQAVAQRALALLQSPHTLPSDRTLLRETVRNLQPDTIAQLALLLPAMESNTRASEVLSAAIEDAAMQLSARDCAVSAAPSFATLEEAAAYRDMLLRRLEEADRNAYLQACIDTVMARHGYTISRSVTLGRDLAGDHRLFGREDATEGLHAFLSDSGDLMLQVAGLPDGIDSISEDAAVCLEAAAPGARTDELLADQHDFCAVYDEIAADLAAFGITNRVQYRAEPSEAFCRELVQEHGEQRASIQQHEAAGSSTVGASPASTPHRRRKRSGGAAREMR